MEVHRDLNKMPDASFFCGPRNEDIIRWMFPDADRDVIERISARKEMLYREQCRTCQPKAHLANGVEEFLNHLKNEEIQFGLASASIRENIDFFFETFRLYRWFDREQCVYDDGNWADKGEMHVEAARRMGTTVPECVVIEDSTGSIACAKRNGAGRIVAVGEEAGWPAQIESGAGHCIRDFTEFDDAWLTL